ncbi:MAG: SPOR domain-containing protein [Gammaproteobacteria bacterium]|nr:SPOR domain-containing protein [Gammaproteobacteria bacterium]
MSVDQTIKQRLIGAIVLVAIAVVFLPGILGQKKQKTPFVSEIPQNTVELTTPEATTVTPDKPAKPTAAEESAVTTSNSPSTNAPQTNQPKTTDPENKVADKPTSDQTQVERQQGAATPAKNTNSKENASTAVEPTATKPATSNGDKNSAPQRESWVVQVGSFSSRQNAELLAKRLEDEKLKSFVRPVTIEPNKQLYRVYVGPWLAKQQAVDQLPKIADITRLKPIVTAWSPTEQ